MKIPARAVHVLVLLTLAGYVALVGSLVGAWHVDPPAGYTGDTFKQLYKAGLVRDYFPNLAWDNFWASGIPSFRAYPLWPYYLLAATSSLLGLSLEWSLVALVFVSYILIGFGVYLLTYRASGNPFVSLSTALALLATPVVWSVHVVNGLFNEILGLVFLPFILLLAFRVADKLEDKSPSGRDLKLMILLSAVAISFHPLMGLGSFFSATVIVVLANVSLGRKLVVLAASLLAVFGLDAYLAIPLVTSSLPNVGRIGSSFQPNASLLGNVLAYPVSQSAFILQPWTLPLLVGVVALVAYTHAGLSRRSLALLSLAALSIIFTNISGGLALNFVSFVLLAFFASIALGFIIGGLSRLSRDSLKLLAMVLALLIILASVASPLALSYGKTQQLAEDPTSHAQRELQLPKQEMNYRIAISGADAWTSQWFNYRYAIPQTSSYAGLSLINVDWNTWFGEIWLGRLSLQEVRFMLSWWGVKWILIDTDINSPEVFLANPDQFDLQANVSGDNYLQFLYSEATPIVEPTNAPAVLALGDDAAYNNFLRALSLASHDNRNAIPVRDARELEDYTLEELRDFDLILLYGFDFGERSRAFQLLDQYVRDGGALLVDTGYSALATSSQMPESFPVSATFATDFGVNWQLTSVRSEILAGIQLQDFGPAKFGEKPWGMSASTNSSVREWAETILWDAGHPVIVAGSFGEGRVVWTGLNLPYHILSYRNHAESLLLSQMIDWASGAQSSPTRIDFEVRRPDPQHITLLVNSASRGILFKENFFPDWKAIIDSGTSREAHVWTAGPDFMYIRLPKNMPLPVEVRFRFTEGTSEILGWSLSALLLLIVTFSDRITHFVRDHLVRAFERRTKRLKEAWDEE